MVAQSVIDKILESELPARKRTFRDLINEGKFSQLVSNKKIELSPNEQLGRDIKKMLVDNPNQWLLLDYIAQQTIGIVNRSSKEKVRQILVSLTKSNSSRFKRKQETPPGGGGSAKQAFFKYCS